ncbi:transposase [Sphingomonas sp. 1185]
MSDEEWLLVAPYLLLQREDAGQREHDLREVFNGLRYIVKTGAPWRWMPNDLPPWAAVYQQTQRWLAAGCFEALVDDLRAVLRLSAGHKAEPTAAIIDSRTLRSTPESGERAGYDGAKRKKGSKIHMAVDTLGHLLALHVTPASAEDRGEVERLARTVQAVTGDTVELAWVDQAIPAGGPPMQQTSMASRSKSSNCRRPSAALFSCRAAGSSSGHSPGQPASAVSSRTMNAMLKHSPDFTSSLSPAS